MPSAKPYSPSCEDGAALDDRTVGRDRQLALLNERFQVATTAGSLRHTLLVGPHGAGKTHLVEVAMHRWNQTAPHPDRLRVARLPEDMVGIGSYADMLVDAIERLGASEATMAEARRLRTAGDETALQQMALGATDERVLVMVVENLNSLFASIGRRGQHAFRSWVDSSGQVLVLGTSPRPVEAARSGSEPWSDSFEVERLDALSLDEVTTLVAHLARQRGAPELAGYVSTPEGQARLQTVQQLAGGSPRIWTIFAEIVTLATLEELVPAVEDLLEGLVPYYQQRLWELPTTEQKLVVALAAPDLANAPVRQVAERAGVEAGTANVTLRRLEESGWVRGQKMPGTDQRSTWYELREPLFRHYLQYRQGHHDTIRLVVDLLRTRFEREVEAGTADTRYELAHAYLDAHGLGQRDDADAFARLPAELRHQPAPIAAVDQRTRTCATTPETAS
jgi:AAA ATPase domain